MAWLPLESNPDVLNKFLQKLGVPEKWNLVDVYGLDAESLGWVPQPAISVILLFPCSDQYNKFSEEQCNAAKESGQVVPSDVFYMKQIVSNACGTVALIHCIANNLDRIEIADGPFKKLLEECQTLSPQERGELLQKSADEVVNAHSELALEGQTVVNPNEKVNHHFVAFVQKDGHLLELDGRRDCPINHGTTSTETFLVDTAKVCKEYIDREPNDVNFTVMALTSNDN